MALPISSYSCVWRSSLVCPLIGFPSLRQTGFILCKRLRCLFIHVLSCLTSHGPQAFVLSTWVIILSNDPASLGWFRFHPLLQSLSIGCFIYGKYSTARPPSSRFTDLLPRHPFKGILTLQPTSQPSTKAAGLERHKIAMLGLGIPLILLGTLAVFLNKNSNDAPHFTSLHGVSLSPLFERVAVHSSSRL